MISSRLVRVLRVMCALVPALACAQDAEFERYRAGQNALDHLQWRKALDSFEALPAGGAQADAALYWKAFARYKLGQGGEALAGIAGLRKSFPQSAWLPDAETLAAAIARNDPPAKDATAEQRQSALEDRVRAEPAHADAALREAVFGIGLPGVRQKAFYALSRRNSAEAREAVLQVARGAANPDLQSYAISQLGKSDPQAVADLYPAVGDVPRLFILAVLATNWESARLMRIAAVESSDELRYQALKSLVDVGTDAQVAEALRSEKAEDVRRLIENHLASLHKWVADQLAALHAAQDPRERRAGALGLTRGGDESIHSALLAAYAAEKDPDVKGAIVFTLSERRDFAALESMEQSESDAVLKRRIGQALDNGRSR